MDVLMGLIAGGVSGFVVVFFGGLLAFTLYGLIAVSKKQRRPPY